MIPKQEINDFANSWQLAPQVVEKDYALGWMLAGISAHPSLRPSWIFKGGTALKKCFFETYRFSEDLDFSITTPDHLQDNFLRRIFTEVARWIEDQSGMPVPSSSFTFKVVAEKAYVEGRIAYEGPLGRRTANPKVKLDLVGDELVVLNPESRLVHHPYSDRPSAGIDILGYAFEEIFAEKIRALAERCRPRDLYDVIHLYRAKSFGIDRHLLLTTLEKKCLHKKISIPTAETINNHRYYNELRSEWENMLRHQLSTLPPIDAFLAELPMFFDWLTGKRLPSDLEKISSKDPLWQPGIQPIGRAPSNIEKIRMAAANRVCIELTYDSKVRIVEPYSFRQSSLGNINFYGFHREAGSIKAFTVNKIQNVRVTSIPYVPRYLVEIF